MEQWQRNHIIENLPELIKDINCDVHLISYLRKFGALGDADIAALDAKGATGGQHEKTNALLNILETRTGAYEQLAKSLYCCKQTGALLILLRGVEKNVDNQSPLQFCGIELNEEDTTELMNKQAIFGGVMLPIKDICESMDPAYLQKVAAAHMDASAYEQFIHMQPITVAAETIPEALPYYIPRTVSLNTQLDPAVFHNLEGDIFCVEGIELHQLSALPKPGMSNTSHKKNPIIDRSRNQIHRPTARFILLENPEDFHDIAIKSGNVVHWIKHEGGNYTYVKSTSGKGVQRIQAYLKQGSHETASEDDLVAKYLDAPTNAPILLYDSPGMGKSVLLAELARKVKEKRRTQNVMYFPLPDIINKVSRQNYNSSDIKKNLAKLVTTNRLGWGILYNLLDSDSHRVALFLDGYDELPETDIAAANTILDYISTECKNIRIWITTRPHRRHELEERFGVLGYNILPFNGDNKIAFFLKYWQDRYGVIPTEEVTLFAQNCLESIK